MAIPVFELAAVCVCRQVVVCADQEPGNYLINATYDLACPLTKGHFIPSGMAVVPTCSFYAYLRYTTPKLDPRTLQVAHDLRGTGGGRDAQPLTQYPAFDLNYLSGYQMVKPMHKEAQPEVTLASNPEPNPEPGFEPNLSLTLTHAKTYTVSSTQSLTLTL